MDKRISYKIVFDCETAPMDKTLEKVDPYNMFVYDLGWAVVDKRGNVYKTRSFINADIFLDEKELMKSAYYADKIPQYWEQIKKGESILTSFYNIRKTFLEDCAEWGITEVWCHNARFDYGAVNITERWLTKSKYRYFFPKNIEVYDTLKISRQIIAKRPTYIKFCKDNNFITKNGQVQLKAEILYRYITRNLDFEEEHKGLDDVLIEKDILAFCYRQHKAMNGKLFEH